MASGTVWHHDHWTCLVFQSIDDSDRHTDINFDFEKVRLFVPTYRINDKLFVDLESRLAKEAMRQYFISTELSTHSISTGSQSVTFDSVATGSQPQRLYLLVQQQDVFNGKFSKNCYKFPRILNHPAAPFIIQNMKVTLNGEEIDSLSCDKSTRSFRDMYFRLFHLTRQDMGTVACSLTYKDFCDHLCIGIYDFTSTMGGTVDPMVPLVKGVHLRVELLFDKPSTCPLVLCNMIEKQSALEIESSSKCTLFQI